MPEVKIKTYHISKYPGDEDLANFCTHSCNPYYIREIVFRFKMSSIYPQPYLMRLNQQRASTLATINGVNVHIILCSSMTNPHYSLWTFPDKEENIEWYERVFTFLVDIAGKRIKGISPAEATAENGYGE